MSYVDEVLADSPRGYWRLGEASDASPADDASVNTNNGTYSNVAGITPGQPGAIVGDADTAVLFSKASSGYVSVPSHASLDLADIFTLEAWIRLAVLGDSGGTDGQTIISKGANGYMLRSSSADRLELLKDFVQVLCPATVTFTDTGWHHVVATKNGATVKLYIDGIDVTGTITNATCANNTRVLMIGADHAATDAPVANTFMNGTIDEVAVYSTALSAARVMAHYQAGITAGGSASGAIACISHYYHWI